MGSIFLSTCSEMHATSVIQNTHLVMVDNWSTSVPDIPLCPFINTAIDPLVKRSKLMQKLNDIMYFLITFVAFSLDCHPDIIYYIHLIRVCWLISYLHECRRCTLLMWEPVELN